MLVVWRSSSGSARAAGIQVFGRRGGSVAHCGRGRLRVVPGKADERPPGSLCISRGQPTAARAEMKTGAHAIETDPQSQAAMGEVSQPLTPTEPMTREVVHLASL